MCLWGWSGVCVSECSHCNRIRAQGPVSAGWTHVTGTQAPRVQHPVRLGGMNIVGVPRPVCDCWQTSNRASWRVG